MAKKKTNGLGRQILQTMRDLSALIADTHHPQRIQELMSQYRELEDKLEVLIEANLDSASEEYKAATKGLREASAKIQAALSGMETVAEAIAAVGHAVGFLADLA